MSAYSGRGNGQRREFPTKKRGRALVAPVLSDIQEEVRKSPLGMRRVISSSPSLFLAWS